MDLKFTDYLDKDKVRTYTLKEGELLTDYVCPIDGMSLIKKKYYNNYLVHFCPNCDLGFGDVSPLGLKVALENFIKLSERQLDLMETKKKNLKSLVDSIKKREK